MIESRAICRCFVAVVSCFNAAPAGAHDPQALAKSAVQLITNQMEAWNRGDLDGALQTYCPSADTLWVNHGGISRGFEQFARGMRKEFGVKKESMGTLNIELVDVRHFGDGSDLLVVRWWIMKGSSRQMGGISTQLWSDCDGKMRVVFEHAT